MIDRFNRRYFSSHPLMFYRIAYHQQCRINSNRDNLPSAFTITGVIKWCKEMNDLTILHNSIYPSKTNIDGRMEYWINGKKVTKLEAII